MNDRIKKVRKAKGLTQLEFGKRLGIKQNSVALIESGKRNTSEQVILAICREFDVNENWLRTGEGGDGAMFIKLSRDEEIADFLADVMREDQSDFRRRLVSVLAKMTPEEWAVLERKVREFISEMGK